MNLGESFLNVLNNYHASIMEVLTVEDFPNICRFCISKEQMLKPLKLSAVNLLETLTKIEIQLNDEYPKNICSVCVNSLNEMLAFLLIVKNNESCLKRLTAAWKLIKSPVKEYKKYTKFVTNNCKQVTFNGNTKKKNEINITSNASKIKYGESTGDVSIELHELEILSDGNIEDSLSEHNYCKNQQSNHKLTAKIASETSSDSNLQNNLIENDQIPLNLQPQSQEHLYEEEIICGIDYSNIADLNGIECNSDKTELNIPANISDKEVNSNLYLKSPSFKGKRLKLSQKQKHQCNECGLMISATYFKIHLLKHINQKINDPNSLIKYKNKKERKLQCSECGKMLFLRNFNAHLAEHKDEKLQEEQVSQKRYIQKVQCYKCGILLSKNRLSSHLLTHSTEKPHKCKLCLKSFKSLEYLKRHERLNHLGIKPFKCTICDKGFVNETARRDHLFKHTGVPECECKKCNQKFQNSSILTNHNYLHKLVDGEATSNIIKPIQDDEGNLTAECLICQKKLNCRLILVHARKHSGTNNETNRSGICPHCGKKVKQIGLHILIHGERQHQCEICARKFVTITHLRTHMLTHTGEKPHPCRFCGQRFALAANMRVHERLHTGERPFKCNLCVATFYGRGDLNRHLKKGKCIKTEMESSIKNEYKFEEGAVVESIQEFESEETNYRNNYNEMTKIKRSNLGNVVFLKKRKSLHQAI